MRRGLLLVLMVLMLFVKVGSGSDYTGDCIGWDTSCGCSAHIVDDSCCYYGLIYNGCYYDYSSDSCEGYCEYNQADCDKPSCCKVDGSTLKIGDVSCGDGWSCDYSSADEYDCGSGNCGNSENCHGSTYYCVYDNGWTWETSEPDNFCCSNSDCNDNNVCTDDSCSNYRCSFSNKPNGQYSGCTGTTGCSSDGNGQKVCACINGQCKDSCGDGTCQSWEDGNNCPYDCGCDGCVDRNGNCVSKGSWGYMDSDNTKDYCDNNGNWHEGICVYTSPDCISYFGNRYTSDSCGSPLSMCISPNCDSNCQHYAVVCKGSEDDCSDDLDNDCDGKVDENDEDCQCYNWGDCCTKPAFQNYVGPIYCLAPPGGSIGFCSKSWQPGYSFSGGMCCDTTDDCCEHCCSRSSSGICPTCDRYICADRSCYLEYSGNPNAKICCKSDDDCKDMGVTCDDQGYYHRYAECDDEGDNPTYTCSICDPCEKAEHCEDGYCCTKEIPDYDPSPNPHQCKPKGTIINVEKDGKKYSYVCDPPLGFSGNRESNSFSFFDWLYSILNPFS